MCVLKLDIGYIVVIVSNISDHCFIDVDDVIIQINETRQCVSNWT